MSMLPRSTDVFIIGGGPAGLAAAIAMRQRGLRVLVADSAKPPIDKACGEGLMPDSLAALSALGVTLDGCESAAFRGIKFLGAGSAITADFPQGMGLGVRRTVLQAALIRHATQLGVEALWGTRIWGIRNDAVLLHNGAIRAKWVIGADGQNSTVRKWAGLSRANSRACRFALRQHFSVTPWSRYVEVYWADRGQAYVTPVSDHEICLALISKQRWESFELGIAHFPTLAGRISTSAPSSSVRGALSISRRLARASKGNIALIGEASGSVDAITGDGMGLAFRQARALADAIDVGDLSSYSVEHVAISRRADFMSRAMLWMDKSTWVRTHALHTFEQQPGLFQRLLSFHVGEEGGTSFFQLGWQMLVS